MRGRGGGRNFPEFLVLLQKKRLICVFPCPIKRSVDAKKIFGVPLLLQRGGGGRFATEQGHQQATLRHWDDRCL